MSNNTNNVVSSSSASLATSTPVRPTSGHHHPDTAGTPTNAGSGGSAMSGQYSGSHHDLTATASASATSTSMQLNTTGSSGTPPTPGFVKHPSGLTNWADSSPRIEVASMEKESYKAQRKNYRREKKRVASELLNSLQDPAIIVLADWLKVRGTLKSWTKLWCVLKPGLLLLYKSPKTKSSHWVGTILLTSCQIIERPSKKDGFCFKLFHPLDQTIWAPRGPDKESIGAVVQPLPTAYLIFRAPSQAAGKCWLDALELSLRCSALLLRSASGSGTHTELATGPECGAVDYGDFGGAIGDGVGGAGAVASLLVVGGGIGGVGGVVDVDGGLTMTNETQWSEADYEKHFHDHDLDVDSQTDGANAVMSGLDSDTESDVGDAGADDAQPETPYVYVPEAEFGEAGEQVEELAEENKSLIWYVLKQVRPGMDLSKVVLPTFILEPRSFLDKLSDSYYHADYLSQAVLEDDPFTRMKLVVKWYLSGFYKKPKGLKKPYNPCLGEKFRCYWQHDNGSRTFYIAEQVSHHPPVSAFYVTNRQDGFTIGCSMLAKSKFYGNSTSAILDGTATLTLLPRGESYTLTIPYAHCKGILMGTLSMELGGKVTIDCENTGYTAELEFKLKPFLGGSEYTNMISGRLRLGKETLAQIKGHWDGEMTIKDTRSGEETVLFTPSAEVRRQRLRRFTVAPESLGADESERLWQHVSAAIAREDQVAATAEKTVLEDAQRTLVKERAATCTEWQPALFQQDLVTGQWHYKWADQRPWDPRTDVRQYEAAHEIRTKTRLLAPMVRTASIINTEPIILQADGAHLHRHRHRGKKAALGAVLGRRVGLRKMEPESDADGTDTSHSTTGGAADGTVVSKSKIVDSLKHINHRLDEQTATLTAVKGTLDRLQAATQAAARRQTSGGDGSDSRLSDQTKAVLCVLVGILLQSVISWLFGNRV